MGIADDIQPKLKHNTLPEPESTEKERLDDFEDVVELKHTEEDEKPTRTQSKESPEKDTFFAPGKTPKRSSLKRKIITIALALFVIGMIALAISQNIDLIKRRFSDNSVSGEKTTANTSEISQVSTKSDKVEETSDQPAVTQTPAEQPVKAAPVPAPPDKASFTVRVSNGNGIIGSAQKVASALKTAGFSVPSVGNAGSFNYKTTIIYYQTGKEVEANLVKDALSERFVSIQESKTLKTYTILVVVGAK